MKSIPNNPVTWHHYLKPSFVEMMTPSLFTTGRRVAALPACNRPRL
jgi:hypothetical protein